MNPQLYEKLGAFYLGRPLDLETGTRGEAPLLYDSRDLTTHALCVGMTGSGKTGLCISLLEEAMIDGIPALVIDPKGDLGNLLLTFPRLAPEDFEPWVDPDAARRQGVSTAKLAAREATKWREGLAAWGQGTERLERLAAAAQRSLYTPGSRAGLPVSVLASLDAPGAAVLADPDLLGDRIQGVVSGLLGLLGMDSDPLTSREHVLLSAILEDAWKQGRGIDLAGLIHAVQSPPVSRVGVMEVESFFPAKERFALAMKLNHLLAAPGFEAWLEGEPLDVDRLLYDPAGRPRVAIFSIGHLSDAERMFFVTLLFTQVLTWVRGRPGTGSLRSVLYMDEVAGYLPPVAEPPSKRPLLTLLKQARAFGLGVVLATQNPADLDYKALSNIGTWFLGRLQTERDRERVMDGLLSAAPGAFDRSRLAEILAALPPRAFLLHDVHEDGPVVFETRWAMSYLRGPLARPEIQRLAGRSPEALAPAQAPSAPEASAAQPVPRESPPAPGAARPVLPAEVPQTLLTGAAEGDILTPCLLAEARVSFVDARRRIDHERELWLLLPLAEREPVDWRQARRLGEEPPATDEPPAAAGFAPLPADAARAAGYRAWERELADVLYRDERLELLESPSYGVTSQPGEDERSLRIRLGDVARERRDREVDEMRAAFRQKAERLEERRRKARQKIEREEEQARRHKLDTMVSMGGTLLSAVFGRKLGRGTVSQGSAAVRRLSRSLEEGRDVERAREDLAAVEREEQELSAELERRVREIEARFDPQTEPLDRREISPRRADVRVERVVLAWAGPAWLVQSA